VLKLEENFSSPGAREKDFLKRYRGGAERLIWAVKLQIAAPSDWQNSSFWQGKREWPSQHFRVNGFLGIEGRGHAGATIRFQNTITRRKRVV